MGQVDWLAAPAHGITRLALGDNGLALQSAWTSALVVLAAIVLGGGGTLSPVSEMALQIVVAGIFIAAVGNDSLRGTGVGASASLKMDSRALLVAALIAGLPWLQLVPLPPAVWQALPGRDKAAEALALVGARDAWMPWTLSTSRTLGAALAMLPPVLLFLLVTRLDLAGRALVLAALVAGCVASVMLGALQLAGGSEGAWRLYEMSHLGWLTGFQANRNAQADVLLIGLLGLAALFVAGPGGDGGEAHEPRGWAIGSAVVAGLLLLGVVLTGSRMGIALLAIAIPIAVLTIWQGRAKQGRTPSLLHLGFALAVPIAAVAALLQLPTIQRVASRFLNDGDSRAAIWEDTWFAIAQHWPAGSGIGTFEPVFAASESLEHVGPKFHVHAHSDWLEFILEAGLPGMIVLAVVAVILGAMLAQGLTRRARHMAGRAESAQLVAGFGILVIIALHSLVDYPLRSMSLACLAAVGAAMHFPVMTSYHPGRGPSPDWGSE